jgi:predicted Zn-dependent protease
MKKRLFTGFVFPVLVITGCFFVACDKDTGFNLFTLEQDKEFGDQMDSAITADPVEFPILDKTSYPDAYTFMNSMMDEILVSNDFVHKDDFDWEIIIINKDVMNAFAVPGGRIYFYTGLMKYLDNSANLAGVVAHEMAHVDRRHSTEQLTKAYGIDLLLSMLTGDNTSQLAQIALDLATGLTSLQFSRTDEYEADEYSVRFLEDTRYHPKGISGFFEQLKADGHTAATFEFLSTHPSDDNRLESINSFWVSLGSPGGEYYQDEYQSFITSDLP